MSGAFKKTLILYRPNEIGCTLRSLFPIDRRLAKINVAESILVSRQLSGQLTSRGVGHYAALHFVPIGGVSILAAIHGDGAVPGG